MRVRSVLIMVVALAAGLLPALAGPAVAQQPAPELPRTGFEESNGARWTTLAEETQFLRDVDAASDRVLVERVGASVQGRPIRLVRLGEPAPAGPEQAAAGSVLLVSCQQHGNEPAAREGCLSRLRDLAFTTDPAELRLLRATTVLFVPTMNPDGRAANTRENADGVDINRDHVALATPEAQTLARVVRDWRPDVAHDTHEFGATPGVYDRDFLWLWPRNRNVAAGVHDEGVRLARDYVRPSVEALGQTSGEYGIHLDPATGEPIAQVAGDGQERILRNTLGLKHAVGLLVESKVDPNQGAEATDPALNARRRVDAHLAALDGTFQLLGERRDVIEAATQASRDRAVANTGPVSFAGADNMLPPPDEVLLTPPCSYTLTADQFAQVRPTLALHGVTSRPAPDGERTVPMAQEARPLVPLLLDGRADYHLVAAVPVDC